MTRPRPRRERTSTRRSRREAEGHVRSVRDSSRPSDRFRPYGRPSVVRHRVGRVTRPFHHREVRVPYEVSLSPVGPVFLLSHRPPVSGYPWHLTLRRGRTPDLSHDPLPVSPSPFAGRGHPLTFHGPDGRRSPSPTGRVVGPWARGTPGGLRRHPHDPTSTGRRDPPLSDLPFRPGHLPPHHPPPHHPSPTRATGLSHRGPRPGRPRFLNSRGVCNERTSRIPFLDTWTSGPSGTTPTRL